MLVFNIEFFVVIQAGEGYIIINTYRKTILRLFFGQLIKNSNHHRGRKLFGGQTISSANHFGMHNIISLV